MVNKVYNDLGDVLQTGWEAFLSYLLSVGPESLDKLFASVADKTQQQVYQEAENSIAKQVVSIAGQEHKANTVMSPLSKGAVAAALKHPNDALLQAAARVVQTQAAPVKKDKLSLLPPTARKRPADKRSRQNNGLSTNTGRSIRPRDFARIADRSIRAS